MATHEEAEATLNQAFELVAGHGANVKAARAMPSLRTWYIEVEVTEHIRGEIGNHFTIGGVPITVSTSEEIAARSREIPSVRKDALLRRLGLKGLDL